MRSRRQTPQRAMAERARRRLKGRPEVGLDRATIERRTRLGRDQADAIDEGWPNGAAYINPTAAALAEATRQAGLNR